MASDIGWKRIGLYGGSFDPVHKLHIQLAQTAIDKLQLDEIWILVDKNPRDKTPKASYEERIYMTALAARDTPRIVVDRYDFQLDGRTHDHKTIQEIKNTFPTFNFTLIIGLDVLANFPSWQEPQVFCENIEFATVVRPPYTIQEINRVKTKLGPLAEAFRCHVLDFNPSEVSSTFIRSQLASKTVPSEIHPEVHQFILSKKLYQVT